MWARYRKTFASMQLFIGVVTLVVLLLSQRFFLAGAFFCTMQLGAVFGAAWAARLERLFLARPDRSRSGRSG
jgi:hypothetical protein